MRGLVDVRLLRLQGELPAFVFRVLSHQRLQALALLGQPFACLLEKAFAVHVGEHGLKSGDLLSGKILTAFALAFLPVGFIILKVDEVAETLGISKSYAYKIVQKLNAELKEKGYLTISGRVNKQYFMEKTCYGTSDSKERK
jgi:hypothetical protein